MRIVFMGSPDFAVPTLDVLIHSQHEIVTVYSQPPRPSGRGQKVNQTPVHNLAELNAIPVLTPEKFKEDDIKALKALNPDLIIVVAYGLILPEGVLNVAPCINLHPSALPLWRGAAPMNYPVLNGETTTDICIMEMEKGLDSGPVYLRKSYSIGCDETAGELHDRFKLEGAKHMLDVVDNWAQYKNAAQLQVGETTYAHKFKSVDLPEIRALNFSKSAKVLHNQIRGLSPWPGAIFNHEGAEIKVLNSTLSLLLSEMDIGQVCAINEGGVHIQTGEGVICLTQLQRAGKRALPVVEFLKGYPLKEGDVLS
tara:strand:+ start:154749 stop:155678 length:930 start_codon:yes stop_codon:yes gene_type:complete